MYVSGGLLTEKKVSLKAQGQRHPRVANERSRLLVPNNKDETHVVLEIVKELLLLSSEARR
jgi:hypothetical protein